MLAPEETKSPMENRNERELRRQDAPKKNVQWESADGTWNLGFYEVLWEGDDPERSVEYNYSRFGWVSTGHMTPDAAWNSWRGADPAASTKVAYTGNAAICERYDDMARECKERKYRL